MLKVRGKWYENRTISLGLDSWGTVQKLDQSTTDTRSDIAVSVIKTVLGFAGLPSFPQQSVENLDTSLFTMLQTTDIKFYSETMSPSAPSLVIGCSEMQADLAALLLDVRADTKIGVVTYLNRQPTKVCEVFKADQLIKPENKRKFPGVVKALVEIVELRSIRSQLLDGVVVQGSLSSDFVTTVGALDGRIDKILGKSFMGTVSKEQWTWNIPFVPEPSDTETTVPLLIVDPEEGICAVDGAEPRTLVQLGVPKKLHADSCGDYPISLVFEEREETVVQTIENATANLEKGEDHGFVYRLPGRVDVTVQWTKPIKKGGFETDAIGADTLLIAQYGPVLTLPTSAGGKKTSYDITLYPETGALKSFDLGSDPAISAENVTAVGDALLAKEKAEREQDDQLARLTREKDILKAMKEIEALREELGAEEEDSGE